MSHVLHALLHSLECEILVTALIPLKKTGTFKYVCHYSSRNIKEILEVRGKNGTCSVTTCTVLQAETVLVAMVSRKKIHD